MNASAAEPVKSCCHLGGEQHEGWILWVEGRALLKPQEEGGHA